jgi:hypothetical protein
MAAAVDSFFVVTGSSSTIAAITHGACSGPLRHCQRNVPLGVVVIHGPSTC